MAKKGLTLPKWRIRLQEYIVSDVTPKESTTVLDCGCGVGYGADFAAASGKTVIGVDTSKHAIREATKRASLLTTHNLVNFIRCSVVNLPLRPKSFDTSFCILLIDAFKELKQPLEQIAEVLNHGGKLIIADIDPTAFSMRTVGKIMQYWDKRSGHPYGLHKPFSVQEVIQKLGFSSVRKQRKHMGLSPPFYIIEATKT
jgi:ubiquinone/menaquinone biosynthesis C-methylase UbiE